MASTCGVCDSTWPCDSVTRRLCFSITITEIIFACGAVCHYSLFETVSETVNCLAPGWFKTAQNAVLYENEGWLEYLKDRIPLNRPGKPNDLDGAVVFLASDASEYVTGQTLLVDGGISTGATKATVPSGT